MTQPLRVQSESSNGASARNHEPSGHATQFFSDSSSLSQVAQTLAAHGGGAVSVDLALDLVLNEVVEQARKATGASGAAVALFRDGALTCRATTGEHAPDLGVQVDASGLAGACASTGEIQQCCDTETDLRVDAEACQRLGVRSMLIAPLVDHNRTVGIIQAFSALPNAFGRCEISALQVLAGRIAENIREADAGLPVDPPQQEFWATVPDAPVAEPDPAPVVLEENSSISPRERVEEKPSLMWSSVLIVLVIATAIALGVAIGWPRAARVTAVKKNTAAVTSATMPAPSGDAVTDPANVSAQESSDVSISVAESSGPTSPAVPPGGLVVTENGKVVYRSPGATAQSHPKTQRSIVRRVKPVYPADAKAQRVQGAVVLDVQVLGTGSVGQVAIVSGDPMLTQAAVDAVKQWRYQPDVVNGPRVESQTRVTVKFILPPG